MKIKIIDLLNKIANGEEVPKKIKFGGELCSFDVEDKDYHCEKYGNIVWYLVDTSNNMNEVLDAELEIIGEPKKIEKLDVALLGQCDNWLRCPTNKVTKQDVELNPYIIDNIRENTLYFQRKINELIDEINNLKYE